MELRYQALQAPESPYPMVAPAYAAARSHLAKTMGLGRPKGTKATAEAAAKAARK